jgi:hypothetical protein
MDEVKKLVRQMPLSAIRHILTVDRVKWDTYGMIGDDALLRQYAGAVFPSSGVLIGMLHIISECALRLALESLDENY